MGGRKHRTARCGTGPHHFSGPRGGCLRHVSWEAFEAWRREAGYRVLLFTTKGSTSYLDFRYHAQDILLFGRETAGVPEEVAAQLARHGLAGRP